MSMVTTDTVSHAGVGDLLSTNGFTIFMIAFVVVGLPVILGCSLEAFRVWTRHKEKMATALNAQAAEKAAQYAAHTERLENRVRVLERIATDGGADLAHESSCCATRARRTEEKRRCPGR